MKYLLMNQSQGNLQVDLFSPTTTYKNRNLHRMAPVVSLNLKKGTSTDLLPHFGGSLEKTHECVKHSRDVLRLLRPDRLIVLVCDDDSNEIDVDALLGKIPEKPEAVPESRPAEKSRLGDETKPDMGEGALLAAVDHHEAEAAAPVEMEEEDSKSKKKKSKKSKTSKK